MTNPYSFDFQQLDPNYPYRSLVPLYVSFMKNDIKNYVFIKSIHGFINGTTREVIKNFLLLCKDNNKRIVFDNMYEGHVNPIVSHIHELLSEVDIDPRNCYYITSGFQANKMYDKYCMVSGIYKKLNIIIVNFWESELLRSSGEISNPHEMYYPIKNKEKVFLCFNRRSRSHRYAITGLLLKENLLHSAFYSFFDTEKNNLLGLPWLGISQETFSLIKDMFDKNTSLFPIQINITQDNNKTYIDHDDIKYFENSYFSLVNETNFFCTELDESVFFSEKIFKPIFCKHPFILVSRPHSLKYLKKLGYETFEPFIDESYDSIENSEVRLLTIIEEIKRLSKQSNEEWMSWQKGINSIVEHNFKILTTRFNEFKNNTNDIYLFSE